MKDVVITLQTLKSDFGRDQRYYSCDVDGTHYTNSSIVTLRSLLRRKYGNVNFTVNDER
jgi:hypothetical protein